MSVQERAATAPRGSMGLHDPQNCRLLLARATANTALDTQMRMAMNTEVRRP